MRNLANWQCLFVCDLISCVNRVQESFDQRIVVAPSSTEVVAILDIIIIVL